MSFKNVRQLSAVLRIDLALALDLGWAPELQRGWQERDGHRWVFVFGPPPGLSATAVALTAPHLHGIWSSRVKDAFQSTEIVVTSNLT
jgi:hypothetical protein